MRTSRLAVASIIVAVLSCPCLVGPMLGWVDGYVPVPLRSASRHVSFRSVLVVATLLPVAAIARVRLSGRSRTGIPEATFALCVVAIWWGLLFVAWVAFRGWPGRRD